MDVSVLLENSWPLDTSVVALFLNGLIFLSKISPRKNPEKYQEKSRKSTNKNRKQPNATANFKIGTASFRFFGLQPTPLYYFLILEL